jgi:hypothetical protein
MKNVTITLDEDLAKWLRVEAAKAGKSVSRYVGEGLAEKRGRDTNRQLEALERFLSGPGYPGISKNLPSREELYAERLFRRHEHPVVRGGSKPVGKESAGKKVSRRARSP